VFGGSEERGRTAARRAESAAQGAQAGGSAVGAYLAAQRRLRGISLDELAERTVIPRRNLERLESGAFDGNADGFTRGFVRTVSEALGLDPNEAVMRLMREPAAEEAEAADARRRRAILACAAIGGLVAVFALLAVIRLLLSLAAPALSGESDASNHVYRTDSVRALAEAAREEAHGSAPRAVELPRHDPSGAPSPARAAAPGSTGPPPES